MNRIFCIVKVFIGTAIMILLSLNNLFAQGTPCGDSGDPDAPSDCPLDNGVLLLVIAAVLYVTIQFSRRQRQKETKLS